MSLPAFISRAGDAALPLFESAGRADFIARLEQTTLELRAPDTADKAATDGYLLAVNLAARLYPRLVLHAPDELRADADCLAEAINPEIEVASGGATVLLDFGWGAEPAAGVVRVSAWEWNAELDRLSPPPANPASSLAAMAGACLGMAAVFRYVFAAELGNRGRTGPEPAGFNLVTLGDPDEVELPLDPVVELGVVHLAGCGAIGQACALALAAMRTRGRLLAVDHEQAVLTNAQRYLVMQAGDIGRAKPDLIKRAFAGHPVKVERVCARWGVDPRARLDVDCVLCALDTLPDRIGVQAGLPGRAYNAWTKPGDLGFSRHERFGTDECLACLCWPPGKRPDRFELIAEALCEYPLRVSHYLRLGRAVGEPLTAEEASGETLRYPRPPEADRWTERSLLEDVLERRAMADGADPGAWAARTLDELYRDGICGGELLERDDLPDQEMAVPLAHQSALAGAMLATQLVVAHVPALRAARSERIEGRLDLGRGGQQTIWRPTGRHPSCVCQDESFVTRWQARWTEE
jgi:hypothetical protein